MKWSVWLPLVGVLVLPLRAQGFGEERVQVEASFVPASAAPGAAAELVVEVAPMPGWHVYGKKEEIGTPTALAITKNGGLLVSGSAVVPDGKVHRAGALTSWWLEEPFTVRQRFTVPATAQPGPVPVEYELEYMACTPELCDPKATAKGSATLQVAAGGAVPAQDGGPGEEKPARFGDDRIDVEAWFEPARVKANGKAKLVLRVTPAEGYHVYGKKNTIGDPIDVADASGPGVNAEGNARVPDGKPHGTGALTTYWLGETFPIEQDVRVAKGTAPGVVPVRVKITYMACTEQACDQATSLEGTVELVVEAGEAAPEPAGKDGPASGRGADRGGSAGGAPADAGSQDGVIASGLLAFLLAAVGWGLFALAMPCTYPMIPITISFFTKQAAARGGSVLSLALVYGLGIVLMFVVIGAAVGAPIQAFATHPVTNLVFAAVFLVFALSLFGLFTLQPPRWAMNLAGQASGRGGYGGVFLMGATLVITSFTCTAPFVGTLIGSASGFGLGWVVLGMAVFGLTMAVPFVLLSLLPARARALPRGGEWMNTLKVFLGFVEVAAALKFVSNADLVWQWGSLPRDLFLWLWAGIFGVAGMHLLGMIRLDGDGTIGPGRLVGGLCSILFAVYCVFGALGSPLDRVMTGILPNYSSVATGGSGSRTAALEPKHTIVRDDHDRAVALAAEEGKLVLLNFTGYA